jgi:hypothetical protein
MVARFLRKRRRSHSDELPAPEPDARADALRRQLAESREGGGASPADPASPPVSDVDEARRRVHEHGRAAVDEMRRGGG